MQIDTWTSEPMATVILGGARCVWDDFLAWEQIGSVTNVVAINDVGVVYNGPIAVWVSLHPEKLINWLAERRAHDRPDPDRMYFHRDLNSHERRCIDHPRCLVAAGMERGGSSGLFATLVALQLWRDNVVLCGIPLLAEEAHFFSDKPWEFADNYRGAWIKARDELIPRVRSMSGWTQEYFGQPDEAWLKEGQHA